MNFLMCPLIFFSIAAAPICYLIGRKRKDLRDYFASVVTGVEFGAFFLLFVRVLAGGSINAAIELPGFCGLGLSFRLDGFRILYGTITAFMWLMTTLFSKEYFVHYRNRNRYYFFLLLTLGAVQGVFLSNDFYTAFLFFEMMSFTSYVWVAHDEKEESMRAAATYLAVAVIGGLVMLMGIFLLYHVCGTLRFDEVADVIGRYKEVLSVNASVPGAFRTIWIAGFCMLFGFGAKAGMFPLHIWLPKAHPVAPAPASALLSGILTKAGIFGILILTCCLFSGDNVWGNLLLILGLCTMVIGAVLALFSVDLKRTLACSSVSQIGFILTGVFLSGLLYEENMLAVRGSLLHMVNHSLIKLVLFMAAGVVFMNVHKLDLNEIRGFGRKKPLLNYIFLMGCLAIAGVPLFNGYVSKTLIHESIIEYGNLVSEGAVTGLLSAGAIKGIEWIFLISGGLTAAYMAKLYFALFVEKNVDDKVQEKYDDMKKAYMNKVSASVLTVCASILPIMGILPDSVMGKIADMSQGFMQAKGQQRIIGWFSFVNLKGAAVSLLIGAAVYFIVVRLWLMKKKNGQKVYVNRWHKYLDLENIVYRPVLLYALPFVFGVACRALDSLADGIIVLLRKSIYKDSKLPHELEEGTYITYLAGSFVNGLEAFANATIWRKQPKKTDYVHKYAMIYEELSEDGTIVGRSLSFGLLLFCIGLIITVVYLLL